MKSRIFVLAVVAAVALVPAARGTVRTHDGPSTTAPDVFVNIQVRITDTRIALVPHSANRGDEARFIIFNVGTKRHSFTVGGAATRGSGAQTGFSRTLRPGEQKTVLMFLSYRGPLRYGSTVSADRTKPGMKGVFTVT